MAGGKSGAVRAAIFGLNDGIVSNVSLIMGVAGGVAGSGADPRIILLAGMAGLLAGAFSMGAGEYVSMRVQRELFERLIHIEAHEIGSDPEGETEELARLLERRGIPAEDARRSAQHIMADPDQALDVHAREEFGLDPEELGSPWTAAASSFLTFAVGAFVPLVPFLFAAGAAAAWTSVALSLVALFSVGAGLSVLTERPWLASGGRMALIGGVAAVITHLIGRLIGVGVP
ncbi:MAG TPA: VIT1/CCC1 transporter family protein [Actinomycetota bacterium]|nr:VIT1/CCC1 transporter family protein [Actinomycetota bacterium]